MNNLMLLFSAPPSGAGGQSGGGSSAFSLVTFGLLFVVMYFFLIRPQSKKKKEIQKKISSIQPGDSVVSIGGIHGVVTHVDQTYFILKVDESTTLKFKREAISAVESPSSGKTAEPVEKTVVKAKSSSKTGGVSKKNPTQKKL